MKEQPKIICEDCGNEIPEGAETCPVCGCPVKVEVEEKPIPVYLQPGTPPRKDVYKRQPLGTAQDELPVGQERVPWGITVPHNSIARCDIQHLRR